ncbi:MAG: transketolase [Alphaproteobacteria bacterium]
MDPRSIHLRELVLEALEGGGRGHVGSTLSLIEILRVLYDDILRVRPLEPDWPERDRLILSKGHGCIALYALLADKGFIDRAELAGFCRAGSRLGGHPERGKVPGVEASTGALGHGLPVGLGMALAQRMRGRDARVFVVCGDGEINEGSVWEAAMIAAKHRLDNLTVIVDYNKIQSAGFVADILPLEPLAEKWRAFGFAAREVDGHDVGALEAAFRALPFEPGRPSAVICHTVKGRGIGFAENDPTWHHKSKLPPDEAARLRAALADAGRGTADA